MPTLDPWVKYAVAELMQWALALSSGQALQEGSHKWPQASPNQAISLDHKTLFDTQLNLLYILSHCSHVVWGLLFKHSLPFRLLS
jgi:hypothetical protein